MGDSIGMDQRQYVLFELCGEEYGLPIDSVQSIIRYEEPTPVPHAPEGVEGVFNLRGQVLPLIDLGRRLRGEQIVPTPASRIIVTESGMGSVGLAVDSVHEVASLLLSDIRPAPQAALAGDTAEAFQGVATYSDRLVILLDPDKALPKPVLPSTGLVQEGDPGA
ncbi:MAG: purine-binding chemotaxis protein CheW [Coriobacteriia bacterium]|nr:purine-binding chemotaxis protein CheW [Coriobacteriia bacterium]